MKEGLSEYFIFTVPGTETVKNGWSSNCALRLQGPREGGLSLKEYGDQLSALSRRHDQKTVKNGWSKRLRLFEGTKVPVKVAYRYRPEEYGDQLVRLYLVRNDQASTLGDSPLPDGAVRLFRTSMAARATASA